MKEGNTSGPLTILSNYSFGSYQFHPHIPKYSISVSQQAYIYHASRNWRIVHHALRTLSTWKLSLGTLPPLGGTGKSNFRRKRHQISRRTRGSHWGSWQVDIGETGRALESTLLVGVIKIGYVDPAHRRTLEATLGKVTCTSPSPDITFTCRIGVLEAVNHLMNVGAVRCDSVKALETEAIASETNRLPLREFNPVLSYSPTVCKF